MLFAKFCFLRNRNWQFRNNRNFHNPFYNPEKDRNLPKKHSRLKGLRNDYEFPGRHNIKFAEIKALVSPRYDERIEYLRQIQIDDFDLVIFITENHLRAVRFLIMPDLNVPNSLKCFYDYL